MRVYRLPDHSRTFSITGNHQDDIRIIYGVLAIGEIFFFKTKSSDWPRNYYWIFAALIALTEFMNYKCHKVLRNLRTGSGNSVDPHKRGIPRGWGFDQMLCANYTWEILTWVIYTIMTKSWISAGFMSFGAYTMAIWAKKKKRALLDALSDEDKEKGEIYKRALLLPGVY